MALFSNKIETAKFVDHQEKTIEVLYKQTPESVTLSTYILELNYNSQDFLDLLEEVSIEQLQDNTREFYGNIHKNRSQSVHAAAEVMFMDWIANAQIDLDKQDEERYKLFEKYKEEQLSALQSEVDAQVERRVSEGFEGIQAEKEEQLKILQAELDAQIKERYKEADEYKEEQLSILQNELDAQIEERYKEVATYKKEQLDILEKEIDEQVESRIAEGFKDVDAYREKQLEVLQSELDTQIQNRYKDVDEYKEQQLEVLEKEMNDQVEGRFKEADAYKEEQLKILQSEIDEQVESRYQEVEGMKKDLLSKFNIETNSTVRYTPEKAVKYIIDNFEDEDTIFKTKLEIFNLPEVKNSKDREMKMKVRKAKTVPEIFAAYHDIQCNHS